MKRIKGNVIWMILRGLFISIIALLCLFPILWVFTSSFKSNREILSGTFSLPQSFQLDNYVTAFKLTPFVTFFKNSIITACFGTIGNLIIMGMAAYAVARFRMRHKGWLRILFSSVLFIPGSALLYPLYNTMNALGLKDTHIALILVYIGFGSATTFYIIQSYTMTIPVELEEAAYIDGGSVFYTYLKIIVPICKPCFAAAAVLQFLLCWNEFQFALILTTGNKVRTLPIALYYFTSQFSSDYGAMMAATVMVVLPSICIFILLQKQIISGMVSGAVKG